MPVSVYTAINLVSERFLTQILRLNGVPTSTGEALPVEGYIRDPQGSWRPIGGDMSDQVEAECVGLHDCFAAALFGEIDRYYTLLPHVPQFVALAGLNSEAAVTRDLFETWVKDGLGRVPELHRLLYLYDCRTLVAAIQECTKEVGILTGEFYRLLNLEPFFEGFRPKADDVRYSTSPVVTLLTATLGFIYIRLHSLLDYIAKLAHEAEHLHENFDTYPKLTSAKILFGDRKRLAIDHLPHSLFEKCDEIDEIETLRNRLIHDGLLDDMPKAYEVWNAGAVTERFLLMPDRTGRRLDRYKGRSLFYGREDKVNLRLPKLITTFNARMVVTLKDIRCSLNQRGAARGE